jgi:hypothetical protein
MQIPQTRCIVFLSAAAKESTQEGGAEHVREVH